MPRHQAHSVARRNAAGKVARTHASPPITLDAGQCDPYDDSGRLKVIPVREFSFVVPYELGEGKFSYEDAVNPVNQLGPVLAQAVPVATSNDFQSFLSAFNKRTNFEQRSKPGGDDDIDPASLREALELIDTMPQMEQWDENDSDRSRWINKFDDRKARAMTEAYSNIAWADPGYLGTKDLSVKQEILIKRDDPTWAPRVIYAGNDAFNAITGPASMVIMERVVEMASLHALGGLEVRYAYKTSDVKLCAFIIDDDFPFVYEGDFSRNDREQRSGVAVIYDAWLGKLGMPNWYRSLLFSLEHYKVQNKRFGFRAKCKYALPTGTTSTTPRNSTYNYTMAAVTCKRLRVRGKAVILGDDILMVLSLSILLSVWVKCVASFKMVLKAKEPQLDGEATFLSRRIIVDVDTPCMVPLIGKMLVRFNCRGTMNDACTDSQYMAGKALSYAYECRHVPFLRDYFLRRYAMEDAAAVTLDDLTWFARTSGVDLTNIVEAIRSERVLVTDDQFECWLIEHHDCTLVECRELFETVIVSAEQVTLDLPNIEYFRKDYE
jgi:hypothetical protein